MKTCLQSLFSKLFFTTPQKVKFTTPQKLKSPGLSSTE